MDAPIASALYCGSYRFYHIGDSTDRGLIPSIMSFRKIQSVHNYHAYCNLTRKQYDRSVDAVQLFTPIVWAVPKERPYQLNCDATPVLRNKSHSIALGLYCLLAKIEPSSLPGKLDARLNYLHI